MNSFKLESGAIAWLTILLLVIASITAKGSVIRKNIIIDFNPLDQHLDEKVLEETWMNYVKIYEGDWIHFNFKTDDKNIQSLPSKSCKTFSIDLINYFLRKGMPTENLIMKFSPTAMVVVYKEPGRNINANVIEYDTSKLQYFNFNNHDGAVCETKAGNQIIFYPNSFIGDKNGQIEVVLTEHLSKRDFVNSGYTSTSNNRLLCSNGMFEISASCNAKPTDLKPGATASIKLHEQNLIDRENDFSYMSFYGDKEKGIINWQADYSQKVFKNGNKTNADGLPSKKQSASSKRTVKTTYLEITYVQLNRKLKLLEKDLYNLHPDLNISATNYNYLVAKYNQLQFGKDVNLIPIKDFKHFQKLMKDDPSSVFIGLTKKQKDDLKEKQEEANEQKKKKLEELQRKQEEAKAMAARQEVNKRPLEMKINQLGSINCDRFYGQDSTTNVIVKIDDADYDQIKVYTVFTNINSVIHGYYRPEHKGIIRFDQIPEGEPVLYIAVTFKGDQVKLAYVSKNIESNETVPLVLNTYSKTNYKRILDDLLPN